MDKSLIEKQNGNFANTVLGAVPSVVYNEDCVEGLKRFSDNHFDLAIVDPPYGLGKRTTDGGSKKNTQTKFMDDIRRSNWDDNVPTAEYWEQLFRVSKNQIIWGGNYFGLPAHRTFIVWDKMTYVPTMSQIEQAWTSFDSPARLYKINSNNAHRIHPTEKPVALYKRLLNEYAKEGDLILDTHLGSGANRIACAEMKFSFVGFELDKIYYEKQEKRFKDFVSQLRMF
jgi:site-specific DNA-methyltransferase (adenine-specific)